MNTHDISEINPCRGMEGRESNREFWASKKHGLFFFTGIVHM